MVEKQTKWTLLFSKRAAKDTKKIARSNLKAKAEHILDLLEIDPFTNPPPYKKLIGSFKGYYSRRINIQHRLVYKINIQKHKVIVLSMWCHYDD